MMCGDWLCCLTLCFQIMLHKQTDYIPVTQVMCAKQTRLYATHWGLAMPHWSRVHDWLVEFIDCKIEYQIVKHGIV